MGLLANVRQRKEEKRQAHEAEEYERAHAEWKQEEEELRGLLDDAHEFRGFTTDELASQEISVPVMLKKGEKVFAVVQGAGLIEPHRGQGLYSGGYSGFSFRLMRGVRFHVGGSRSKYTPGEEKPTIIERGTATITSQRLVFQGTSESREWAFSKLLGYQHDPKLPLTMIHVSNRQKVSGILYDYKSAGDIHFRLALATALFSDSVDSLVTGLQKELAEHEAAEPGRRSLLSYHPSGGRDQA